MRVADRGGGAGGVLDVAHELVGDRGGGARAPARRTTPARPRAPDVARELELVTERRRWRRRRPRRVALGGADISRRDLTTSTGTGIPNSARRRWRRRRPRRVALGGADIAELEQASWLNRYQVDGLDYMAVNGWDDPDGPTYQFIKDKRTSKLPAPTSDSRTEPRTDDVSESRTDARSLDREGDPEGEREQDGDGERKRSAGRSRGTGSTPPVAYRLVSGRVGGEPRRA